ncbi:hypothetical protein VF21_00891 [Pseudogymnoascus sp. 05NY08]|nr:hypothetical protein VF21_00891 [Pseudogymnoascus sp. 05NY08]
MSTNPQTQSAFLTLLPPEIRDAIYLSLWRSHGLRQHIIWHGNDEDGRHFCHWPCTTDFSVDDSLQRDIEELRIRLGVYLGHNMGGFASRRDPEVSVLTRRLQSPWINHWACGERAAEVYGIDANWGFKTAGMDCWKTHTWRNHSWDRYKEHVPSWSPYLPMLLSCKLLYVSSSAPPSLLDPTSSYVRDLLTSRAWLFRSEECLKSIYESTIFIFTDIYTPQSFLGHCALHPAMKKWPTLPITPPALHAHARTLELALMPDFPSSLLCATHDLPSLSHGHEVYDFHWLHLPKFHSLRTLNIWISARSLTMAHSRYDQSYGFTGITEHDADALQEIISHLSGPVLDVTLSTPLAPSVGPPGEGYLSGGVTDGVTARVYKRGSGDRFHPELQPITPGGTYDGIIYTSRTRYAVPIL